MTLDILAYDHHHRRLRNWLSFAISRDLQSYYPLKKKLGDYESKPEIIDYRQATGLGLQQPGC